MIKLRYGYVFMGIVMGLVFLWQFLTTLPDGKLHITFCDVGQGDSAYLRFPDGRDMLIDGGPGKQVISCLSKVMPFWDRHLDGVVLTHPEQDHFYGLLDVLKRYSVGILIRSDSSNSTPSYQAFVKLVSDKHVPVRFVSAQDQMRLGPVVLRVLWPTLNFLSLTNDTNVLSSSTSVPVSSDINRSDFSVVMHLRFGTFDAVFTRDADQRVEDNYTGEFLSPDGIEVLKVPHHGSATGMTEAFIQWLHPKVSVISVAKNNRYYHPTQIALDELKSVASKLYRTDQDGNVTVVTDGKTFNVTREISAGR